MVKNIDRAGTAHLVPDQKFRFAAAQRRKYRMILLALVLFLVALDFLI